MTSSRLFQHQSERQTLHWHREKMRDVSILWHGH